MPSLELSEAFLRPTDVEASVCMRVSVCLLQSAIVQEQRCCELNPFTEIKARLLALTF